MTLKGKILVRTMAPLVLGLAVVMAGCAGGAAAAGNGGGTIEQAVAPAIGVSPSMTTVKAGDEFDVNIVMKTKSPVRAAGCQLTWTGTGKVECTGKPVEGDFFQKAGKSMLMGGGYDAATGTKNQVAVSSLVENGSSGEGTLVTFHFKAVAPGEVNMKLSAASQDLGLQITDLADKEIQKSFSKCDGKVVVQ